MAATLKYWKEAATLILAARIKTPITGYYGNKTLTSNYKVLMLQRAAKSGFFPSGQVFPGGAIDQADFTSEWLDVFQKYGNIHNSTQFGNMLNVNGTRPPMMQRDHQSKLPIEVAFRICAIRETFEESGVLLLKDPSHEAPSRNGVTQGKGTTLSPEKLKRWRKEVHGDAAQFLSLCHKLQSVPDVWSLAEWSNWLTPSDITTRRFDTMFYIACLDSLPEASEDEKETVQSKWVTPLESLQLYAKKETFLPPPQVYEFRRLLRFDNFERVFEFSSDRALSGCQRFMPVRCDCKDGTLLLLPGDDAYPTEPIMETNKENRQKIDKTCDELGADVARTNRITFRGAAEYDVSCTAEPECGHVAPVQDEITGDNKSKI